MNEPIIRFLIFICVFFCLFVLERKIPQREKSNHSRYLTNLAMMLLGFLFIKYILPLHFSDFFYHQEYGLYKLPFIFDLILTIILFDFFIYLQHRIFHWIPILWRLHKVHHADTEMDLTTGVRFHPLEISISLFYKLFIFIILMPRLETFLIYEILLSSMALYSHSNIKLSEKLEKKLSKIIITPKIHLTHHDTRSAQMNKNFGNFLIFWDKLFKSFSKDKIQKIGLSNISKEKAQNLFQQIILPIKKE